MLLVRFQEGAQVDVVQLVPVERVDRSRLLALLRCEAQASPTPEWLRLRNRDDLGPQPRELRLEESRLTGAAAHDDALDARTDELGDLVLGERVACDRDERLRVSSRRVTEPGRLPAGEDDRLH